MKYTTILLTALTILLIQSAAVDASWLIDVRRFYFSSHGEFSCDECHIDVAALTHHPNPAWVNRSPTSAVSDDACSDCHEKVIEGISGGRHGRLVVTPAETFNDCLSCHDAHYPDRLTPEGEKKVPVELRQGYREIDADLEKYKDSPLALSDEDKACLACHGRPPVETVEGRKAVADFCLYCHGFEESKLPGGLREMDVLELVPPQLGINPLDATSHSKMGCLECHPDAAGYRHGNQQTISCRSCHAPHPAITANDPHLGVDCEACHLKGILPVREPVSGRVIGINADVTRQEKIHDMVMEKTDEACLRCHHPGNAIGAPTRILPPKSLICMPCHAATFSAGDTITIVSLVLFGGGLLLIGSVWISGITFRGRKQRFPFAFASAVTLNNLLHIFKILVLDVLVNRRLYARSPMRWLIHSMIFMPFCFRFFWGLTALIASHIAPDWPVTWQLLDRNHPATAFFFDLTGFIIIMGVGLALVRKGMRKTSIPGLPGQDLPAMLLIGGLIVMGFVLEGIRMAMVPLPPGAELAFIGYLMSRFLSDGVFLNGAYTYVWYTHAALTGILLAYLPFSRMLHIIIAPIIMVINSFNDHQMHQTRAKENL